VSIRKNSFDNLSCRWGIRLKNNVALCLVSFDFSDLTFLSFISASVLAFHTHKMRIHRKRRLELSPFLTTFTILFVYCQLQHIIPNMITQYNDGFCICHYVHRFFGRASIALGKRMPTKLAPAFDAICLTSTVSFSISEISLRSI
jgi:hypothetical protein